MIITSSIIIALLNYGCIKYNNIMPGMIYIGIITSILIIILNIQYGTQNFLFNKNKKELDKLYNMLLDKNNTITSLLKQNNVYSKSIDDLNDNYYKNIELLNLKIKEITEKYIDKENKLPKQEIDRRNKIKLEKHRILYETMKDDIISGLSKNKIMKKYHISRITLNNILKEYK